MGHHLVSDSPILNLITLLVYFRSVFVRNTNSSDHLAHKIETVRLFFVAEDLLSRLHPYPHCKSTIEVYKVDIWRFTSCHGIIIFNIIVIIIINIMSLLCSRISNFGYKQHRSLE